MRILFLTYGLPYPPHSGARLRDYHLLRAVAQRHTVRLFSLLESSEENEQIEGLKAEGIEVGTLSPRRRTFAGRMGHAGRHLLSRRPLATLDYVNEEAVAHLRAALTTFQPDILQIEHSFLAPYIDAISLHDCCRTVLDLHNLGADQYRSMLHLQAPPRQRAFWLLKYLLMCRWEVRWAARFDRVLTVSKRESDRLAAQAPNLRLAVIENGVDTAALQLLPEPSANPNLLFVGTMGYAPNVDAVSWFCHDILPLVRRELPAARLWVVGRHPRPEVQRLAEREDVIVTGAVPDVRSYYARAQVIVTPLRAGGGTRLKILESMALARPVVTTTLGCEGFRVVPGEHLLVADAADAFAAQVLRLLRQPDLRARLCRRARDLVEREYDWSAIGQRLLAVYEDLACC